MQPFRPDTDAELDTGIVVQRPPFHASIPASGPKAVHISANSLDSSGAAETVYLTLISQQIGILPLTTGWKVGPESVLDAETMALVSDDDFMRLLQKAEHDLAEGRGVSGEELRRRRS